MTRYRGALCMVLICNHQIDLCGGKTLCFSSANKAETQRWMAALTTAICQTNSNRCMSPCVKVGPDGNDYAGSAFSLAVAPIDHDDSDVNIVPQVRSY